MSVAVRASRDVRKGRATGRRGAAPGVARQRADPVDLGGGEVAPAVAQGRAVGALRGTAAPAAGVVRVHSPGQPGAGPGRRRRAAGRGARPQVIRQGEGAQAGQRERAEHRVEMTGQFAPVSPCEPNDRRSGAAEGALGGVVVQARPVQEGRQAFAVTQQGAQWLAPRRVGGQGGDAAPARTGRRRRAPEGRALPPGGQGGIPVPRPPGVDPVQHRDARQPASGCATTCRAADGRRWRQRSRAAREHSAGSRLLPRQLGVGGVTVADQVRRRLQPRSPNFR